MTVFSKMLRTRAAATLLFAGIATGAHAFSGVGGTVTGIGGGGRYALHITGKIVCANCSLDEVRKAQPDSYHLYQLTHKNGQVVVEVKMVNDSARWSALTWPPRLWVRAENNVFQQLVAEQNLFKDVKITGILSNSRTFDVLGVDVQG
jgi:hypothetical protein